MQVNKLCEMSQTVGVCVNILKGCVQFCYRLMKLNKLFELMTQNVDVCVNILIDCVQLFYIYVGNQTF